MLAGTNSISHSTISLVLQLLNILHTNIYVDPCLQNSLPDSTKQVSSMYQFKSKFKQFLLSRRLITQAYIWQYACVNAAEQSMTILFVYVMLDQESQFCSTFQCENSIYIYSFIHIKSMMQTSDRKKNKHICTNKPWLTPEAGNKQPTVQINKQTQ